MKIKKTTLSKRHKRELGKLWAYIYKKHFDRKLIKLIDNYVNVLIDEQYK